ncbi:DksA/TraR family C4-type zinc finger protein [Shewanella psychropiezotolerans]|uniref:DksA/TraR family C4-type zinc finger protein n=1 Tax=Shewanella psychropiezotolerans TaxID=2593655 RepID=A0ABX5WV55_9GAMM|nr:MULTISPECIES: DksA/TraR family C4-type zinc finger protein [Shewanella]MPY22756.1 DksA/TraR family C4-type zinc finger protein [Shewanella sp. YLB-07]QDO82964.1 DksA/TraR family C4-type zinc finger protein [Shewanella psychropiezotolerans]
MAGGWSRDGAVQEQIDSSVGEAVAQARGKLSAGSGLAHCEECGTEIPLARRDAVPGVRLCISCQAEQDNLQTKMAGYNRRGSKDSQLR